MHAWEQVVDTHCTEQNVGVDMLFVRTTQTHPTSLTCSRKDFSLLMQRIEAKRQMKNKEQAIFFSLFSQRGFSARNEKKEREKEDWVRNNRDANRRNSRSLKNSDPGECSTRFSMCTRRCSVSQGV